MSEDKIVAVGAKYDGFYQRWEVVGLFDVAGIFKSERVVSKCQTEGEARAEVLKLAQENGFVQNGKGWVAPGLAK